MKNTLKKIYDNYKIFHPDGTLMSYTSEKKAKWYFKKDLATIEDKNVYLNFIPNGYGDPIEILEGRQNICVISGDNKNLTKHHVVPYMFRKRFPLKFKDKNSCDIVLLTRELHDEYEIHATKLKIELIKDYVDPFLVEKHDMWNICRSKYNIITRNYDKLPPEKQIFMQMSYEGLMDKYDYDEESFAYYSNISSPYLEEIYLQIINNVGILNLIAIWKKHFIKYGKPKYLPSWWKWNNYKTIQEGDGKKAELKEIPNTKQLIQLIQKYNLM